MTSTLLVRQGKLAETRVEVREPTRLDSGQVRARIDLFALTANNITYAAFGEAMEYWKFFPSGKEGWGIVPVWGFGTVVQSLHPGVAVGEKLYGYWPMADEAVLLPDRMSAQRLTDAAPHRAGLHAIYNQYLRSAADPLYTPGSEDAQALLRPLFVTSWLIDDFLADNSFFGARTVMLSSASSKTAYAAAHLLAQRAGLEVVGFTSAKNKAFCESLGCYTRVLTYEQFDAIDANADCVYVDFAGDAPFRQKLHERFVNLKYSCSVGGTHIEALGGAKGLAGPRPVLFFAPAQGGKRVKEWGPEVYEQRLGAGWRSFLAKVSDAKAPWLIAQHHRGAADVQAVYAQVLAGRSDPRTGQVLTFV